MNSGNTMSKNITSLRIESSLCALLFLVSEISKDIDITSTFTQSFNSSTKIIML